MGPCPLAGELFRAVHGRSVPLAGWAQASFIGREDVLSRARQVHMAGPASQLESPLGGGRGPGEEVSSTSALRERADPICVKFLEYLGRRIFSVVAGEEEHSVPFGAGRACCGFNF